MPVWWTTVVEVPEVVNTSLVELKIDTPAAV
jgi:hypothetical protein